jgi:hypothetical protein
MKTAKLTRQALGAILLLVVGGYVGYSMALFTHRHEVCHLRGPINACANSLRQIQHAKEQYAASSGAGPGAIVEPTSLDPYIKGGSSLCTICRSGGVMTIGVIEEIPKCSIKEHQEAFLSWNMSNRE